MDATRFDRLAKLFADRRLSRRQTLTQGGAGLVAGALAATGLGTARAQEATPAATSGEKTMFLFLQSFRSGTVVPKEGADGTYTLTLEQGLGQTVYFSDRPERIVGTAPTPQFLEGLGFAPDNPPNAALVVETAPGDTEIAVVELTNSAYETMTHTATYDVKVLAEWENELGVGLTETPTDLAAFGDSFGAAHLFIDDCSNADIVCHAEHDVDGPEVHTYANQGMCYNYGMCMPCEPYGNTQPDRCQTEYYWRGRCNAEVPACKNDCMATLFGGSIWNMGC